VGSPLVDLGGLHQIFLRELVLLGGPIVTGDSVPRHGEFGMSVNQLVSWSGGTAMREGEMDRRWECWTLTKIEELILEAEVDHRRDIDQIASPVVWVDSVGLSSDAIGLLLVLLRIQVLSLLNQRYGTKRLCLQFNLSRGEERGVCLERKKTVSGSFRSSALQKEAEEGEMRRGERNRGRLTCSMVSTKPGPGHHRFSRHSLTDASRLVGSAARGWKYILRSRCRQGRSSDRWSRRSDIGGDSPKYQNISRR
jgi:hypothetical protein